MSGRISKTPQAKLDLAEQARYIAADNLDAALRFLDAAERDFTLLSSTPFAGAKREFRRKDMANVRCWPIRGFENYLVFYRPTHLGIEVLRVLHGARDIGAVFDP